MWPVHLIGIEKFLRYWKNQDNEKADKIKDHFEKKFPNHLAF